jgi:hypothetical protein
MSIWLDSQALFPKRTDYSFLHPGVELAAHKVRNRNDFMILLLVLEVLSYIKN